MRDWSTLTEAEQIEAVAAAVLPWHGKDQAGSLLEKTTTLHAHLASTVALADLVAARKVTAEFSDSADVDSIIWRAVKE